MIDLINVTKTYETGTHALNGIDMHIDDGEFVFLVGQSGSGKSTIIKLLTAELKPTSGSILVNGYKLESIKRSSVPYMRRTLGVIFQDFRLIENKTVYENVAFAMRVIGARPRRSKSVCPTCWSWSGWKIRPAVCRTSCPAANSSVWPLPVR